MRAIAINDTKDMNEIIEYVVKNKEWVFSGMGVAVIGYFLKKKSVRNYLKAFLNINTSVTQINIDKKENEEE